MRSMLLLLVLAGVCSGATLTYDQPTVNNHPGYQTAWETSGPIDKVMLFVSGFDLQNTQHPKDKVQDFVRLVREATSDGWDVIYFDYVDGAIDLKQNADNLARFIEYLGTQAVPGYHLAVVGGSMGGIVARTMFVQEYSGMGVRTYVSLDSPHRGVVLSAWVEDLAESIINNRAARQMHAGDSAYNEHYGWLEAVEGDGRFLETIIDPMHTCAIALSDGEGKWEVNWGDLTIHNHYYPVASYLAAEGQQSTYMPYHSTIYAEQRSTERSRNWFKGTDTFYYRSTKTRYFDEKVANKRAVHGAPDHAIRQAVAFVLRSYTISP
eukprot:Sspe_Gene.70936::Locus_41919_Transcript_2_2_Confidence_0.667_Length_2430::g.70936::m.70936